LVNLGSVEKFIEEGKEQGLTHLVLDGKNIRLELLDDAFYNDEKYPYLIKIFDSAEKGFNHYHVKIFEINYQKFDQFIKNDKENQ